MTAQHSSEASTMSAAVRADMAARADTTASARDYGIARVLPVVTLVFSVVYFFGVYTNYGPLRYYPFVNQWSLSALPKDAGPAMMWYGWVINGIAAGVIVAALALLTPRGILERLWQSWAWLIVLVPTAMIFVIGYFLRGYFM